MSVTPETEPAPIDPDAAHGDAPPVPPEEPGTGRGILLIAGVLAVVCGLLVYGNLTMRVSSTTGAFGPQTFGWIVAALCLLAALLIVLEVIRHPRESATSPAQDAFSGVSVVHDPFDETVGPRQKAEAAAPPSGINWVRLGCAVAALVAFTLILEPLGWLISATLLFWAMSLALGGRRHVAGLIMGLGLASLVQVVFGGLLGMSLPPGVLGWGG